MTEYRGLCFCFSSPTECGSCTFRAAILALSLARLGVCVRLCWEGGLEAWGRVEGALGGLGVRISQTGVQDTIALNNIELRQIQILIILLVKHVQYFVVFVVDSMLISQKHFSSIII